MPKTPAAKSAVKSAPRPPVLTDFRKQPELYRILRGEQGVFTTPPYSAELKGLWKFKDEVTAKESAEQLFTRFASFKSAADFVGMDISRKFIQMGRTRSLRYALRPGGRKYDKESGQEIKRTGEVADESKLKGAGIFESYLKRIEGDSAYAAAKATWRVDVEGKRVVVKKAPAMKARGGVKEEALQVMDDSGDEGSKDEQQSASVKKREL